MIQGMMSCGKFYKKLYTHTHIKYKELKNKDEHVGNIYWGVGQ